MSIAAMLSKFQHLIVEKPAVETAPPRNVTAIVTGTSNSRRIVANAVSVSNATQKRNATHDIHAKRALTRAIVEHQVTALAHEFMRNTDRSDLIEPHDDCITIRCNQTGMPFLAMPSSMVANVSGDIWRYAYTAPIAMYKSAIDYAELLRLAPSAYMVQFLFRLCSTPFRSGKQTIAFNSPMDAKAFARRGWLFDYFNDFDSASDEERMLFMRLCGAAFMLHRVGMLGPHSVPSSVADAWRFGEFYQLVVVATDDATEGNVAFDISTLTSKLIDLYALMALHYNPIFWQRNSTEFGISATWADFEQIRLLHNAANTPQIRIPIRSKHELMVDGLSALMDEARREENFRFGVTSTYDHGVK